MPEIINYRQGAVVNVRHGKESAQGLTLKIEGLAEHGHPVTVNGVEAQMDGRRFSAEITLKEKFNTVTASELTPYGRFSQELTLVWDKQSFKRFNFYIDDHSFLFTDLTRQKPVHAFDHFYLAALKKIHDATGFKVTLNSFFENNHDGKFTLDQMPDIWKSEFQANSDWLKFSFHAKGEFPDRPYIEASAEEYGRDYDQVMNEIIRFAGAECFIPPVIMHWGNIHPAVAQEMIRRGARCNAVSMRPKVMGGPSLADRQKGGNMDQVEKDAPTGEDRTGSSAGFRMFYEREEENSYMTGHSVYYDPGMNVFVLGRVAVCCNLVPLARTASQIQAKMAQNDLHGCDLLQLASHEQYSFPYYSNYLPDHLQRLEVAARTAVEAGYKPVFFNEGLLGNMAWGD